MTKETEIEVKSHDLTDFLTQTAAALKTGAVLSTSMHAAGWYFATFVAGRVIDAIVDILDDDPAPAAPKKPAKAKAKVVAE